MPGHCILAAVWGPGRGAEGVGGWSVFCALPRHTQPTCDGVSDGSHESGLLPGQERAVINCRAQRPPIGPRARPSIRGRMAQIPAGNGHVTSDNQTERRSPPNTIAVGRGRLDLAPAFGKPLSPPAYKNYPAGPRTPALFPFPITICTQWLEAQCLLSTVAGPLLGNLAGYVLSPPTRPPNSSRSTGWSHSQWKGLLDRHLRLPRWIVCTPPRSSFPSNASSRLYGQS